MTTEAHDARVGAATSYGIRRERVRIRQRALPVDGSKTPSAGKTAGIARNLSIGLDVPDLSLARVEIEVQPKGLGWRFYALAVQSRARLLRLAFERLRLRTTEAVGVAVIGASA